MAYSLYLGDVDPNSEMINRNVKMKSPDQYRSQILFELLMNDSIVMSDSQFLTDPRLPKLLSYFDAPEKDKKNNVQDYKKGFEKLINSGLIEVAVRKKSNQEIMLTETWRNMVNSTNPVPYVPNDGGKYAEYLQSLNITKKYYDLNNMAIRFKHNLLSGTEDKIALMLDDKNDTDIELRRLFNSETVYQRDVFKWITDQRAADHISQARLEELYDYTFGCYNVNISAELNSNYKESNYNCMLSTAVRHIPIHLQSNAGNMTDSASHIDMSGFRPISYWALDENVLSQLSTDAFLDVRQEMEQFINTDMMMKFRTGNLIEDDTREFADFWESYSRHLEISMKIAIANDLLKIDEELFKLYKCISLEEQLLDGCMEFVSMGLECVPEIIPGIGNVISAGKNIYGIAKTAHTIFECYTNIPYEKNLLKRKANLYKYKNGDSVILTKYN